MSKSKLITREKVNTLNAKVYKPKRPTKSRLKSVEKVEGESIETKCARLVSNKEPIKDGAPLIYTEKKEGIIQAYNIRADRWEIATDAMDLVAKSNIAKSEGRVPPKDEGTEESGGPESIQGTETA